MAAAAGPVAGEIIGANAGTAATPSAAGASSGAATPGATPATASPNTALNPGADVSATPATPKPKPQNANDQKSENNSGNANQQDPKNDKEREGQEKSQAPASTWAQSMGAIEEDAKEAGKAVSKLARTDIANDAVKGAASAVAGLPAAAVNAAFKGVGDLAEKGLTAGANSKSTPSPTANIPGLAQNRPQPEPGASSVAEPGQTPTNRR